MVLERQGEIGVETEMLDQPATQLYAPWHGATRGHSEEASLLDTTK